jgi:hypothetical protein
VNILENPIYLTQKRLTHRAGVLAPVLIAALIGASLLAGLIAYLINPLAFGFKSPQDAGKAFYAWVIGVEILILVAGGFSRVSRALAEDRKAGIWDSNRLTPLDATDLVKGYWFGSALREFYMAVVLAGFGLVIALLGRLPITLWLGTQVLVFATALFFGLLGVLVGMAIQRPQNGIVLLLGFVFLQLSSLFQARMMVTNFLVPIYAMVGLFQFNDPSEIEWTSMASVFGISVLPILLSLALQGVIGVFLWRAAVRKARNPFKPLLERWEAGAMFAVLVIVQHGLIWHAWNHSGGSGEFVPMLSIVHAGTMMLGVLILAFASPLPERVRVESLRLGFQNLTPVVSRSAVSLALALTVVASLALRTHYALGAYVWFIATINLLTFLVMFSLLLEYCRLRFGQRSIGFIALGLFVLCALPYILAAVFSSETISKLSFLSPGVMALSKSREDVSFEFFATLVHLGIVAGLFIAWQRQWLLLLGKTTPKTPAHSIAQ